MQFRQNCPNFAERKKESTKERKAGETQVIKEVLTVEPRLKYGHLRAMQRKLAVINGEAVLKRFFK